MNDALEMITEQLAKQGKGARGVVKTTTATKAPTPPAIYEPTVRLVYSDLGLLELFAQTATGNGTNVELLHPEEVAGKVGEHLRSVGTVTAAISLSKMLDQIQLASQLTTAGFRAVETGLAATAESVLITDCFAAVAETGSIAFRNSAKFELPPQSIVILEPKNFAADLIDFFELLRKEPTDIVLLTGRQDLKVLVLN